MSRTLTCAVLALAITIGSSAQARRPFVPPPMPAGYDDPGPIPTAEVALAEIGAGLREILNDPYSVRDFSICPARTHEPWAPPIPNMEWEPARHIILFQLNARNSMGGYVGQREGIATFRGGHLIELRMTQGGPTRVCPRIPDAEIQRAINVGQATGATGPGTVGDSNVGQ